MATGLLIKKTTKPSPSFIGELLVPTYPHLLGFKEEPFDRIWKQILIKLRSSMAKNKMHEYCQEEKQQKGCHS